MGYGYPSGRQVERARMLHHAGFALDLFRADVARDILARRPTCYLPRNFRHLRHLASAAFRWWRLSPSAFITSIRRFPSATA